MITGALANAVPPEAAVYHLRLVPVAVKVVPGPPTHKLMGLVTVGAEGGASGATTRNIVSALQEAAVPITL